LQRQTKPDESFSSALAGQVRSTSFWSLVAAVVGVVAVVAGGILFLSIQELENFSLSVLIVGAVLLFVALVFSPRGVAIFLVGRQARFGTNVLIMSVAFFVIAILVNFLLFRNPNRFDVTITRYFSLAPQTVNVLQNLEAPIRANAFYIGEDERRVEAEDILNEFERNSSDFEFRFEDPELNRTVALRYGITDYPTIVIENLESGALQTVFPPNEQQLLTGILIVTGVQQKKLYILTGHKERSNTRDQNTGQIESEGFDLALEGLSRDNYRVQALNLLQVREVPNDAAGVVVAGPSQDLDEAERDALDRYLSRGGRMAFLLDPNNPASIAEMLADWGFKINTQSIADAGSAVAGQMLTPLVQRANGQYVPTGISGVPITSQIDVTFFPGVTAIEATMLPEDIPPQLKFLPLAVTTNASWLEAQPDNPIPDPGVDRPGPFAIAAIVEACAKINAAPISCAGLPLTKIVVFGDSDFVKNQFFTSRDNADLFLNSINYLTDDYQLISIRPKVFPTREMTLTTNQRNFIQWSSWFLPPALMVLLGGVVWWRRR
jgi:ABC-type uncharacterized transport system involved in gliding motility auxiliary subunit